MTVPPQAAVVLPVVALAFVRVAAGASQVTAPSMAAAEERRLAGY